MRQTASVGPGHAPVRRLMLFEDEVGCYLFTFDTPDDAPGLSDTWFVDAAEARRACREQYGVAEAQWADVPDPPPGCRHDVIAPTQVGRHK